MLHVSSYHTHVATFFAQSTLPFVSFFKIEAMIASAVVLAIATFILLEYSNPWASGGPLLQRPLADWATAIGVPSGWGFCHNGPPRCSAKSEGKLREPHLGMKFCDMLGSGVLSAGFLM